jgi:hypothetical protein
VARARTLGRSRRIRRRRDARRPPGHGRHAASRGATELALTPIPPLVALLQAEERRLGRALVEREVLAVRDRAVCTAMPHAVVRRLEIERGYADVDPELVWEHWQIVRSHPT